MNQLEGAKVQLDSPAHFRLSSHPYLLLDCYDSLIACQSPFFLAGFDYKSSRNSFKERNEDLCQWCYTLRRVKKKTACHVDSVLIITGRYSRGYSSDLPDAYVWSRKFLMEKNIHFKPVLQVILWIRYLNWFDLIMQLDYWYNSIDGGCKLSILSFDYGLD